MGTLFCHSESNPHRILTIFCSHFLKEKKKVNNTPLSLHFHISEKNYSQGNSEFHKFIHSANLLNNYYVPVTTQVLTNSRYTKGKKKSIVSGLIRMQIMCFVDTVRNLT